MNTMHLNEWLARPESLTSVRQLLRKAKGRAEWSDVAPEAKPLLIAALWHDEPRPMLIITPTHDRAVQWQARLRLAGVPDQSLRMMPSSLSMLFDDAPPEMGVLSDRLGSLMALASGEPIIVIATGAAALELTLAPEHLKSLLTVIRVGVDWDLEVLLKRLIRIGYENQEPVRLPGQYSHRGGIIDLFPLALPFPVRIELFGDTVESIREFDPTSQRSIREISDVIVAPARETIFVPEAGRKLAVEVRKRLIEYKDQLPYEARETLEERIQEDALALEHGSYFDRVDLYRPNLNPASQGGLSYLSEDGLVVLDEPLELDGQLERAFEDAQHVIDAHLRRGEILPTEPQAFLLPIAKLGSKSSVLSLNAMGADVPWFKPDGQVELKASSLSPYHGQALALVQAMKNWLDKGLLVIVATDQPHRASQMLTELEIPNTEAITEGELAPGIAQLVHGNLAGGFVMPEAQFAFVTDTELFGVARLRMPAKRVHEGVPIASLLDLKPGDFVVHIYHGVGVFRGLVKMERDKTEREFLQIDYAPPDRMFVPVEQIDRIQKYLAPGEENASVMRLGGGEWTRSVKAAKEGAKKLAGELTRLYAARRKAERPPYSPDTPWQQEMESAFPYVETPSQAVAIADVKEDLQEENPMDRLVCGDVGFGKTEVAVRAAFKAVQDNRQVAIMCPTTILAAQHFDTFRERLAPYPVNVALLSRFRTPKQQKQTIGELSTGAVDIVIGTHRLLSEDIKFKDLGLLIIDEEQRFGVTHKERLKQKRTQVDVMTLTATPIPRTLYMALVDIRDMSVINDPPPGRLAIRTYVKPWDDELVRDAIMRELSRGGQVYLVHNRVESIYHICDKLSRMLPYARFVVGHGQMDSSELERVMIDFHDQKYDVLVCTTIIENGLDIPNVNTIIVDRAHRMGLSQLYQLRGRVGRSDRQAYAYLLYRVGKQLNDVAYQRLAALKEFSELGSGFSLAMRDMQIRGAGELLGAKQHGAMAGVGFELYMQLVNEAIHEIQGTPQDEILFPTLPSIDLPVSALIPKKYVEDEGQRLYYYKRLGSISDDVGFNDLLAELKDRYGEPPPPVKIAFRIVRLRLLARDAKLQKIEGRAGHIFLWLRKDIKFNPKTMYQLQTVFRQHRIKPDGIEILKIGEDVLGEVEAVVRALAEAFK
ncbi:MAG: transcription-repair coupling factor [bacterium]